MHDDLVGLFGLPRCKAAGRDRLPVFFTEVPDYEGIQAKTTAIGSPLPRSETRRNLLLVARAPDICFFLSPKRYENASVPADGGA